MAGVSATSQLLPMLENGSGRPLEIQYCMKKHCVLMLKRRSLGVLLSRKRSGAMAGERGGRRPCLSRVEGKVRTLRRLVPRAKSGDLDGLFQETADYIVGLEMQVKVMQILVKVLTDSSH